MQQNDNNKNDKTYSRGIKWDCIWKARDDKAPENIPIKLLKELSLSFGLLFVYLKSSKNFNGINENDYWPFQMVSL